MVYDLVGYSEEGQKIDEKDLDDEKYYREDWSLLNKLVGAIEKTGALKTEEKKQKMLYNFPQEMLAIYPKVMENLSRDLDVSEDEFNKIR